jgi:hypothetical protein
MSGENQYSDRLLELLAAQQLGDLSPEEHDELTLLVQDHDELPPEVIGDLLLMIDQAVDDQEVLPKQLAESLAQSGRAAIAIRGGSDPLKLSDQSAAPASSGSSSWAWITGAAAVIAIGATVFGVSSYFARVQSQQDFQSQLASLESKVIENEELLSASRLAAAKAQQSIQELEQDKQFQASELAQLENTRLELATQLAQVTSSLNDAIDQIAIYETPLDPAQLAENRRQLMTVPDSVQIAWQPFDLPDAPAEQQGVRGDVVWNDSLQEGYIRFVGLQPNDPTVEQYQIWVIDERGLEQKVSGGVFNASADGEIIVPITPGIDVGRVGLFAITIENPGGTWVPDLSRRVVVAPRDG